MSAPLPGPHHCFGVANAVTEMIFRHLHGVCEAGGGTLSLAEIDAARGHALRSYPGAFAFFEAAYRHCIEAHAGAAPTLLDRDSLLATLLSACGHKAARNAFPSQMTRFGETWLKQFFDGLALYVRQHVDPEIDVKLLQRYAELCAQFGAKLSMGDLLSDARMRRLIESGVTPLVAADVEEVAARLSDAASRHIAAARGIPKPDLSKVTEQEVRQFLGWLPRQMHVAFGAASQAEHAHPG